MKIPKWRIWTGITIIAVAGATAGTFGYLAKYQPAMYESIEDKILGITVPKSYPNVLTPARDLRGIWKSSLAGKGFQLFGKFDTGQSVATLYEDGDIELRIDRVENNIAYGTMRFFNVCAWGTATIPTGGIINMPKKCGSQEPVAVEIGVSSSGLDFGTVRSGDVVASMQGSYTSDIMSGTMGIMLMGYGEVRGRFNLMRQR